MTKDSKTTTGAAPDIFATGAKNMAAFNPMSSAALQAWSEMGAQVMQFMSSRMQQDIETQKAMLGCKSLEDVQKLQSEFFSQALKDYNTEAARLMEIMTAAMTRGFAGKAPSTKRGYDDVPL